MYNINLICKSKLTGKNTIDNVAFCPVIQLGASSVMNLDLTFQHRVTCNYMWVLSFVVLTCMKISRPLRFFNPFPDFRRPNYNVSYFTLPKIIDDSSLIRIFIVQLYIALIIVPLVKQYAIY